MGRLLRLPLTVFNRTGIVGQLSPARDDLTYCDLATDRQQPANDIVRAHHALTSSRVIHRNPAIADSLRSATNYVADAWVYNSASTIRQGVKANTDAEVLEPKLVLNCTGPCKILAVGPCGATETPDGSPLEDNLHHLDHLSDLLSLDARRNMPIERFQPCANPCDSGDKPQYLEAKLQQYVLNTLPRSSVSRHS